MTIVIEIACSDRGQLGPGLAFTFTPPLTAVELDFEAGVSTMMHILNLLHRLIDGKRIDPPVVKPPNALTLTSEPQANVERYDALRKPGRRAMRHNPAAGAVVIMLRSLKMHGMAQAVGELTEQGSPAFEAAVRSCRSF